MRVHLVDGTFELFRAHFSKRPSHTTPDGRDFKATVGVVQSLLTLLEDKAEAVTHLAVAFDNPIVSFRNKLFAGYKSDEGMLPELRSQFDPVEEAVRALGVVVWSMNEWEADDALATAAVRFAKDARVEQVRILTPDKDLGQVVSGKKIVQVDRIRNVEIDEAAIVARRGISPSSIPDFLALVGDTADGIPGLAGFGEKGAATLLAHYKHLEAIPSDASAWDATLKVRGAQGLAQTLRESLDAALLYRKLATLVTDVPLPETLESLEFKGPSPQVFQAWAAKVGADKLPARISHLNKAQSVRNRSKKQRLTDI